jgi:hypothetical protein
LHQQSILGLWSMPQEFSLKIHLNTPAKKGKISSQFIHQEQR